MSAPNKTGARYPSAWGLEMHRNAAGRAFWYVSRFVARNRVEFLEFASGGAKFFRNEKAAQQASDEMNEAAARSAA